MTGRRLHPDDIEAIARRVAELVSPQDGPPGDALLDVKALAARLGVSAAFVYEHAHELGGAKLTDSPKAPWRFDLQRARAAMDARSAPPPPPRSVTNRRTSPPQTATPSGIPLLPIKGKAA